MRCGMLLLLSLGLVSGLSTGALAVSARSWTVSSAEQFGQGTLEGTALDGEGRGKGTRVVRGVPDQSVTHQRPPR